MGETTTAASNKNTTRVGWCLLALALGTPLLMGAAGFISAYQAGQFVTQTGFAWLVAALVIDFITRKRDPVIKANGRIVAACIALIAALTWSVTTYRDAQRVSTAKDELIEAFMKSSVEAQKAPVAPTPAEPPQPTSDATPVAAPATPEAAPIQKIAAGGSEADRMVAFMGQMKERAKKFAEESVALDRKFNAVDLGMVLAPQSLATNAVIQASRKKLNGYKALITERDSMLTRHYALSEKIIHGIGLTEREQAEAIAGLNSKKDTIVKNYADLTAAQMVSLKATHDILNFAERSVGRMVVQNGQLMFQTQPDLDEYQRLMHVLTEAAAVENVITGKVVAQAQQSRQNLADEFKK